MNALWLSVKNRVHTSGVTAVICVFFSVLILWVYKDLPKLYFYNDEWIQLAIIKVYGPFSVLRSASVPALLLGKYRVLGSLLNDVFYYYFTGSVLPFVIFGYVFHIANTLLLYFLTFRLSKSRAVSFIAGLFFATAAISHQALSWPAVTPQTVGTLTCSLVSVFAFLEFWDTKKKIYLVISLFIAYIGYLLKPSGFSLFLVLVGIPFIYQDKHLNIRMLPKKIWIAISSIIALGIYKVLEYFGFTLQDLIHGNVSHPDQLRQFVTVLINCIVYPFVTLTHMLITFRYMLRMTHVIEGYYSVLQGMAFAGFVDEILAQTVIADLVSVFVSTLLLVFFWWVYRRCSKPEKKLFLFAGFYYVASFIPVALSLLQRNVSYIESRYLYMTLPGFAIMAGLGVKAILTAVRKTDTWYSRYVLYFCFLCIGLFTYKQIITIQTEVAVLVRQGDDIRNLLGEFKRLRPVLPDRPVVFLDSDSSYYFGVKVPLQLGPGFMLQIVYYDTGIIPGEFIAPPPESANKYPYLYNFFDQGYRTSGNRGFGYFWDIQKLTELYKSDPALSVNQIIGFYYVSSQRKLIDTTDKIRQTVEAGK